MKTITRLLLIAFVALAIYFGTIGRSDFYWLLDSIERAISAIGANYLRK